MSAVWIHLGILRTRGVEIAASGVLSCCSCRLRCCWLDAAWMRWRRSGYYGAADRRRELALPFGRWQEERINYCPPPASPPPRRGRTVCTGKCVVLRRYTVLILDASSAGRSSRSGAMVSIR